jgi:hypothetical protein
MLEDQGAKRDTSVTVAKIRGANVRLRFGPMDFWRLAIAASDAAIIFISAQAITHLASYVANE